KNAARACESICSFLGEDIVLYHVCAFWFKRFKSGNFSLIDKQCPGGPRKCDNDDLKQLLAENSAQTQKELAEQLGVTQQTISKRLHEMGK
ncbi:Histone-lysine N-methyltransferase SETMAR, partial [Harpegnathos saltator]